MDQGSAESVRSGRRRRLLRRRLFVVPEDGERRTYISFSRKSSWRAGGREGGRVTSRCHDFCPPVTQVVNDRGANFEFSPYRTITFYYALPCPTLSTFHATRSGLDACNSVHGGRDAVSRPSSPISVRSSMLQGSGRAALPATSKVAVKGSLIQNTISNHNLFESPTAAAYSGPHTR